MPLFNVAPGAGARGLAVLLCSFSIVSQPSFGAGETSAGRVEGEVVDSGGGRVEGATIELRHTDDGLTRRVSASSTGSFAFQEVAPGDYVLTATDGERGSTPIELTHMPGATTRVTLTVTEPSLEGRIEALRQQLARLETEVEREKNATAPQEDAPPAEEQEQRPPPGRGETDKGLYEGLAAGAPGHRYARGLFGDAVRLGGYGSARFETNDIDPGPQIGDLPAIKRGYTSFDMRRFVLTLDAAPASRFRFYTEIEFERLNEIEVERTAVPENRGTLDRAGTRFIQEVEGQAGGEIAIEQAWAQWDFTDGLGLRFGVILPPVGRFNILHDDDYWDIPRRPLVDRGGPVIPVKSAWRELGAGIIGSRPTSGGYIDYQAYVVNGATLDFTLEEVVSLREGRNLIELEPEISFASGAFNGTNTSDAATWRVAVSPRLGSEIAVSGYHGEYTPDYLNVDESVNAFGLDGKLTAGGFEVEGEFVHSDFGNLDAVLTDIALQAVDSAAQTFSDETSILEAEVETEFSGPLTERRYGYWVDVKYRFWPSFLDDTFLGKGLESPQLIPIARFEQIWWDEFVDGFEFAGGAIGRLDQSDLSQRRISLGLTYRPLPSVAFSAVWEHNDRVEGETLISPDVLGLGRIPDDSFNTLLLGFVFGF